MKVAIVYPFFSPIDHELQLALEQAGLDSWLVSSDLPHFQYRNTKLKFENPNYKTVKVKAYGSPINDLNLYFPFPILPDLIKTLKQISPDIVLTTEHVSSPSFWCNFQKGNWKTVLLERAGEWDGIIPRFGFHRYVARKFIFPRVDAFAALSSYAKESLRELGCNKHIEVIPNPVDTALFNVQIPWKERRNVVIYVGRLIKLKKIELIIQAMMMVREKVPDAELLLIGDGVDREYYQKIAHNKDYIRFLGSRDRSELPSLYNEAKALVMLVEGKATGISMAAQEAISCGVPIIGTADLPFDESEHIYYFTSTLDPRFVAASLISCLQEGEQKSLNARIAAEKTYSHKAVGTAYKRMIDKI